MDDIERAVDDGVNTFKLLVRVSQHSDSLWDKTSAKKYSGSSLFGLDILSPLVLHFTCSHKWNASSCFLIFLDKVYLFFIISRTNDWWQEQEPLRSNWPNSSLLMERYSDLSTCSTVFPGQTKTCILVLSCIPLLNQQLTKYRNKTSLFLPVVLPRSGAVCHQKVCWSLRGFATCPGWELWCEGKWAHLQTLLCAPWGKQEHGLWHRGMRVYLIIYVWRRIQSTFVPLGTQNMLSATLCVHVWFWWLIEMMWWCHQAEGPAVTDALERGILEPYLVKHWGIKLATNAAITVLRVDQVGTQFNSHTCKGLFSTLFFNFPALSVELN